MLLLLPLLVLFLTATGCVQSTKTEGQSQEPMLKPMQMKVRCRCLRTLTPPPPPPPCVNRIGNWDSLGTGCFHFNLQHTCQLPSIVQAFTLCCYLEYGMVWSCDFITGPKLWLGASVFPYGRRRHAREPRQLLYLATWAVQQLRHWGTWCEKSLVKYYLCMVVEGDEGLTQWDSEYRVNIARGSLADWPFSGNEQKVS